MPPSPPPSTPPPELAPQPATARAPSPPAPASPTMYESPSPPSSTSSGREFRLPSYGSIRRRRAGADSSPADLSPPAAAVVALSNDAALGSISPIPRRVDPPAALPYSDLPHDDDEHAARNATVVWQDSSYVPVLSAADESTALLREHPLDNGSVSGSELLLRSRADLERARLASSREFSRRELREGLRDRFILGCSVLVMTSIVFVIIVSGLTTILANRNYPQLQIFSDWPNGGDIPLKYGCHAPDGHPVSIPLHWRNVPRAATNLVVLFANPGAISKLGYDPVHWFITDIPLSADKESSIPMNASLNPDLMPADSKQRANAGSTTGVYWPPCVTNGTSVFVIHAYAIEASPVIADFKDAREIMNRFVGVPVARLTGSYGKRKTVLPGKGKQKPIHQTIPTGAEAGEDASDSHTSSSHRHDKHKDSPHGHHTESSNKGDGTSSDLHKSGAHDKDEPVQTSEGEQGDYISSGAHGDGQTSDGHEEGVETAGTTSDASDDNQEDSESSKDDGKPPGEQTAELPDQEEKQ